MLTSLFPFDYLPYKLNYTHVVVERTTECVVCDTQKKFMYDLNTPAREGGGGVITDRQEFAAGMNKN